MAEYDMNPQAQLTRDRIGATVLKHLESRLLESGLSVDAIEEDFDLIELEILDSFGFVELIVGVSEDLNLEIDLADLGDEPLATFGDIVTAFARATSAVTDSRSQGADK
jgi:acyl carrier protein